MKRALAAVGAAVAVGLCLAGFLRHRPRRAGTLGGFRCERCQRAFEDLDDAGEVGAGYVRPARPIYTRNGRSGGPEVERVGTGPIE